jgi:hypothetical protein
MTVLALRSNTVPSLIEAWQNIYRIYVNL